MRRIFAFLLVICLSFFVATNVVRGDELADLQKEINDLQKALEASKNATTPLESEVKKLESELSGITSRLDKISTDLTQSEKKLREQREILASTVRNFYIRSFVDIPLLIFFSAKDAAETLKLIAFQQTSSKTDKNIIRGISERVAKLADDKKRLASLRDQTSKQSQFLKGEIASAKSFQSEVQGKIAALSARQEEILAAKSGTFTTSVGDVPLTDDPNASPAFSPGFSPAFAGFSFGAYTHRNGMSQYGAKGRADNGQNFRDILSKYYPGKQITDGYSEPGSITVDGYGIVDFQQYLYGIAEMPSSWNTEALKAQAVAARSYAIEKINRQGHICADQGCQVYIGHSKGGAWEQAVSATRGVVMTEGGNATSTQYSSTTGGYLNTSGWDTKCGSRSCWTPEAWEKIASSPWFYKGWYTQSYSNSSAKCGRSHPWLTQEEMADILNAWLVQGKDSVDGGRITPVTTSCWGGNPYSMSELRDLANSKAGGAVTSISSVSVSYSNDGVTASVSFATNKETINIPVVGPSNDLRYFKNVFNLRAPGYISIRSPLFNIERK